LDKLFRLDPKATPGAVAQNFKRVMDFTRRNYEAIRELRRATKEAGAGVKRVEDRVGDLSTSSLDLRDRLQTAEKMLKFTNVEAGNRAWAATDDKVRLMIDENVKPS